MTTNQSEVNQRFEDLTRYLDLRFSTLEDKIDPLVEKVAAHDREFTKIKAYWTSATLIVGFLIHAVKDYLFSHVPPVAKP